MFDERCDHRKKKSGHRGGRTDVDRPMTGGQIGHELVKLLAGAASSCLKLAEIENSTTLRPDIRPMIHPTTGEIDDRPMTTNV